MDWKHPFVYAIYRGFFLVTFPLFWDDLGPTQTTIEFSHQNSRCYAQKAMGFGYNNVTSHHLQVSFSGVSYKHQTCGDRIDNSWLIGIYCN